MPKVRDLLAPLREVHSKAERLASKLDAAVFDRLGVFIDSDIETWKAPLETSIREVVMEHRFETLAQLQLHSRRAQTLQASARLDDDHAELIEKVSALNLQFEKLIDVFERCLPLFADEDPRRGFLLAEMGRIQSNMASMEESKVELQDEFPVLKRGVQFLTLPEARFEAFVAPLRQQPDLNLLPLDAELIHLVRMWRSRHEWFEEIQNILIDAANKWFDQEVTATEQRKVLREVQRLYRKLRSQVDKQDKLLTNIEEFRDWAIEAPIFLTDAGLGMIEVTELLSVLDEYEYTSEGSEIFTMLDSLLENVGTFAANLEADACV